MSTTTHSSSGRTAPMPPERLRRAAGPHVRTRIDQLELAAVFAATVGRHLLLVLPLVAAEMAQWRARAAAIPSPQLRRTAQASLAKRGNIEGAALLATLAPARRRAQTVRALVAFQVAYNYLDALSELPAGNPVANSGRLHQALLVALDPHAPHPDYYEHNPDRGDGGFLPGAVDACRDALALLPSWASVAEPARRAACRIVDFQTLNHSVGARDERAFAAWATEITPAGAALQWWETAAGAGSSLAVHALVAAAADPDCSASRARDVDRAYFPWTGALHSLLDSLVDRSEDRLAGQRSLLGCYDSPTNATAHLVGLAMHAADSIQSLPRAHAHRVTLTAMCSYYLSAPESAAPDARAITAALTDVLGPSLSVAIAMFRTRRLLHAVTRNPYA